MHTNAVEILNSYDLQEIARKKTKNNARTKLHFLNKAFKNLIVGHENYNPQILLLTLGLF